MEKSKKTIAIIESIKNGGKYSTRKEILERDPILKERFWKRMLASQIIMGAVMSHADYRTTKFAYLSAVVIIVLIFPIMAITGELSEKYGLFWWIGLTIAVLILPGCHAWVYGYKNSDSFDTTGAVVVNLHRSFRHICFWIK